MSSTWKSAVSRCWAEIESLRNFEDARGSILGSYTNDDNADCDDDDHSSSSYSIQFLFRINSLNIEVYLHQMHIQINVAPFSWRRKQKRNAKYFRMHLLLIVPVYGIV